jgi:hypothetical protein
LELSLADFPFSFSVENYQSEPEKINLLKRWLYTPRDDGTPRVLILPNDDSFFPFSFTVILRFIDNIKMVIFLPINRENTFFSLGIFQCRTPLQLLHPPSCARQS